MNSEYIFTFIFVVLAICIYMLYNIIKDIESEVGELKKRENVTFNVNASDLIKDSETIHDNNVETDKTDNSNEKNNIIKPILQQHDT